MDFITIFPRKDRQHDAIIVVVDKLIKEAHFIPLKSTLKYIDVDKAFMKEIFKLHGLTKTIMFDRDTKFNSNFWKIFFQDWEHN
jgi:hypothetical protein